MTYRNCIITPDPAKGLVYTWHHPDKADLDYETGYVWQGYGSSIQECVKQIDHWYEDFDREQHEV